jgi:NitT/TauT family transport system permease protein
VSWRGIRPLWLNLAGLGLALGVWTFLSTVVLAGSPLLPTPLAVLGAFVRLSADGVLLRHVAASLFRVAAGWGLSILAAIPVGFLLGWYPVVRGLAEPLVQFLRTIPPIALIPLVILYLGIDEEAKIFVIWLSSFLTIVITVYQGVRNTDATMVKAARVLGAGDVHLFLDVVVPAALPYILVGMRLGLAAAWTTLIASELIAAPRGLGFMIVQAGTFFEVPTIILGILAIGALGLLMDRGVLYLERRLTSWQDRAVQ